MFRRYSRIKQFVLRPHFSHRGDAGRLGFTLDRGAHHGPCRRPDLRDKTGRGSVGKKYNGPAVTLQGRRWSVWDWLKAQEPFANPNFART
jgi:hypothetical protein